MFERRVLTGWLLYTIILSIGTIALLIAFLVEFFGNSGMTLTKDNTQLLLLACGVLCFAIWSWKRGVPHDPRVKEMYK